MARSSAPQVAVTGVTGAVGGRVADLLAAGGTPLRLVARDTSRTSPPPGSEAVPGSYGDGESMRRAFSGVRTVFLVSGRESADRLQEHRTAIDAAVAAGVERVVYLSFLGAAPDCTFTLGRQHWATEQHLRSSGLAFTFLRDSMYADFVPVMVAAQERVIRGPAGTGAASFVARDDVAEVVAAVLRAEGAHDGATYDVTGPEALTMTDACGVLSRVVGEQVRYLPETLDEAYASRAVYGAPDWEVDGWVTSYVAIANGEMSAVSPTVERLTGHPATTLAQLLDRRPELVAHLR